MKKLLLSLFCFSMLCSCAVAAQNPCDVNIGSHKAVTPVSRADNWWMPRHDAVVERVKQGNVDLIMIGDSITHGWEKAGKKVWDETYTNRNAVNMGFSGDKTEHVIWRLQNGEIENINPKLAVIMIGTNNSNGDEYTSEQIADGVKAIVCQLRTKLPNTKILMLAIFPRGDAEQRKDKTKGASHNPQWEKNDKATAIFKKVADNKMIYFLDINKQFLNKKGELPRDIMADLLHPGEKGYEIWAKAMEPTIVKLMGEKKKK